MFYSVCLVYLLSVSSTVNSITSEDVIINLDGIVPQPTNSEVYSSIVELQNKTSLQCLVEGTFPEVKFLVMQAHSYHYNITVSFYPDLSLHNHVNGTNLGLVYEQNMEKIFHIMNFEDNVIQVYISIHAYSAKAPIPGGCNMESNVLNTPFLTIKEDFNILTVEAATARVPRANCDGESQMITHDFYHFYMPESDQSEETYFDSIKKMITVENVIKHGRKVPKSYDYPHMRRLFSVYHGIGSVYAVIATKNNVSSAYVPNHSYASAIYNGEFPLYMKILFPFLSLLGLFINVFGHYFFRCQIVIFGFMSCSMVTFILVSNLVSQPIEVVFSISVISGVASSLTWLLCLKSFGVSLSSIVLSSFCIGFQVSMVVFYGLPDGYIILQNNVNFWSVFLLTIFIVMLITMPLTFRANIFACALIGSFTALVIIELCVGSYLRYMFVNVIRRSAVTHFNNVIIDPPYQWRDGISTLIWAVLVVIGCLSQHFLTKNDLLLPNHGPIFFPRPLRDDDEYSPFYRQTVLSYGSYSNPTAPPVENDSSPLGFLKKIFCPPKDTGFVRNEHDEINSVW